MKELICKQIGQMCRTCMRCNRENESYFQLYSIYNFVENYQRRRMQICDLLNSTVPKLHKIEIYDALPTNICAICLDKLIAYDEFQNCCIDSELKLRNVLQIDHTNTNLKQNSTDPLQCAMETTTILKQEIEIEKEEEEFIEIYKQQEIEENSNVNPEGIVNIEPLDIVNLDDIKKGDSQAENGILNDPLNTSILVEYTQQFKNSPGWTLGVVDAYSDSTQFLGQSLPEREETEVNLPEIYLQVNETEVNLPEIDLQVNEIESDQSNTTFINTNLSEIASENLEYSTPNDSIFCRNVVDPFISGILTSEKLRNFKDIDFLIIYALYRQNNTISNTDKVKLSKLIIKHILENNLSLALNRQDFIYLSKIICEVFINETLDEFYCCALNGQKPSGKLYDAYSNCRRFLSSAGLIERRVIRPNRENWKEIGTKCFKCDFCKGAFTEKKNLTRHLLKIHNKDARTRLRGPNKLKSKLSNEIEIQSKSKPEIHDQSSTNEVKDSTKSAELNSNNIYESSFQNDNSALTTLKTEVTQILAENCNSDDTLTADKSRLENKTQNFKMWECKNCLNLFYHRKNLARHMKSVHNQNLPKDTQPVYRIPPVYNCDKCEKVFNKKSSLCLHQHHHLNPRASKTCQYCDKTFKKLDKLRDHERTHRNERPYLCSDCGKAFTSRITFQEHRLRHSSERKFQCPQCPKKFSARSNMCSHIRQVHKQIKPFVCEVCGAAFKANHSLKKHTEIHTGNQSFKCDCCDKRFQRKEHMDSHRRTHTGEKPYKCKYCIRCYKARSDLRKHLVTHLGEKTFQCELCPATFRLARERQVHFASHRNDDDETKARNKQARLEALEELELKIAEKSTQ